QAEQALFQDRIAPVPERHGKAEAALPVGEAEETVLPPAIGAAPGMVVRQVVPAGAVGRVVLAHGAPLPFAEVGAPALPVLPSSRVLVEPERLRVAADDAVGDHLRETRRLAGLGEGGIGLIVRRLRPFRRHQSAAASQWTLIPNIS